MRWWLSLLPLLIALPWPVQEASAAEQIYRSVDEKGHVIFSDRPCPEAQEVELQQPNVADSPEHGPAYTRIAFGAPTAGSVVPFGSADHVELRLDMEPRLRAGDRVQLIVDGEPRGAPTTSCIFTIHAISAGSHRFEARVLGLAGEETGRSEPLHLAVSRTLTGVAPAAPPPIPGGRACFSPADSVVAGIPSYQLPEARPVTPEEREALRNLFRQIGPNWRGHGTRTTCWEREVEEESLQVEADFSTRVVDEFTIEFRTDSATRGTHNNDTIELVVASDVLALHGVAVDLLELTATTLVFAVKQRSVWRQGQPGAWQETIRSVALSGSRLTVEQYMYTNGRLTASERWELAH